MENVSPCCAGLDVHKESVEACNIWLFVPIQNKLKAFLSTIDKYPFQQGSRLNAAGVNYQTLKALEALKRLQELETIASPSN